MNENPLNPPPLPPVPPPVLPPGGFKPPQPGEDPLERLPIPGLIAAVECMLRQPRRVMFQLRQPGAGKLISVLLFIGIFPVCYTVW